MKIVYFGTPPFAAKVLEYLIENGTQVVAIVTKPDRPRGRSHAPAFSAVKDLARRAYPEIPLYQPPKASTFEFEKELSQFDADLFVVVAYGEIMKKPLLILPKKGCLNLHASFLPKYRGAAPIQWALLEGAKETGVSVIEMGVKMDAGDLLIREKIPISSAMNFGELEAALCSLGKETLLRVLNNFSHFFSKKTAQIEEEATYVQKVTPDLAKIDWGKDAFVIHNQVRAFSPRPGAWTFVTLNGLPKRLKILKSQVVEGDGIPGASLSFSKKSWLVACRKQALSLLEVQLEGKRALPIEEFLLGINGPVSVVLNVKK